MSRLATSAAAAVALALAAAPAEGQLLRRLQQAAKDRAAEAVGRAATPAPSAAAAPAAGNADAPAAAPGAAGAPGAKSAARAPLAITPERLDQFLAAMGPAMARAERGRAEAAARKRYEAAATVVAAHNKQVQACSERAIEQERPRLMRLAANPMANQAVIAQLQGNDPRLGPLTEAMMEAVNRGDHARQRLLEDSAAVIRHQAMARAIPAMRSCGVYKSGPAEPVVADRRSPEELIVPPAGMTRGQFGRLRERVALYALGGGQDQPFTAEERAALDARAAELAKMTPLFRDGLLEWSQWGTESELGRAWSARQSTP